MNFEKGGFTKRPERAEEYGSNTAFDEVDTEQSPDFPDFSADDFSSDKFYAQGESYAEKIEREKREQMEALRQQYAAEFPVKQLNVETVTRAEYSKEKEQEDREYIKAWRTFHEGKNNWMTDELNMQWRERKKLAQTYEERKAVGDWYFAETQNLFNEQQSIFSRYMEMQSRIDQVAYSPREAAPMESATGTASESSSGESFESNPTETTEESAEKARKIVEALMESVRKEAEDRERAKQEMLQKFREKEEREAKEHQERMRQKQERHDKVMNIISEINKKIFGSLGGLEQATLADQWFYNTCQELLNNYSSPDQLNQFYTEIEEAKSKYEQMKEAEKSQPGSKAEAGSSREKEVSMDDSQEKLLESLGISQIEYELVMSDRGVSIPTAMLESLVLKIMKVENPNDTEAVKKSFRRLAMDWHPDRSSDVNKAFNAKKFAVLNAFYNNIYRPRFKI